jgi:hypothetical protein
MERGRCYGFGAMGPAPMGWGEFDLTPAAGVKFHGAEWFALSHYRDISKGVVVWGSRGD